MITLRDYQEKAVSDIRNAFFMAARSVLLVAPTGAGKTVILSKICEGVRDKQKRALILVHRRELVVQTARTLEGFGIPCRVIAAGCEGGDDNAAVTVATVQTLSRRELPGADLLLIDEAHHAVAGMWQKVAAAYAATSRIIGVTATPERLDGRGLGKDAGGIFDAMVAGPSVADLTKRGYLSRARVFAPPVPVDWDGLKTVAGDWDKNEMARRLNKPAIIGDVIAHYGKFAAGVPTVAFCPTVAFAASLAADFRAAGYRAASLDGGTDDEERRRVIADLGSGRLDVLTSCEIISEGVDVPVVGAAILLRRTKSLSLYLQQVGRALRPYPGKKETVILDHVGNAITHGLPDEEREWSLAGRIKRKRATHDDDAVPSCRQCPKCYAVFDAKLPACPLCGEAAKKTPREIAREEGELKELSRREARREQGRTDSIEDLIRLGQARGYKNPAAWAWYVWNGRKKRK